MAIVVTVTSPSPTGSELKLVDFLRDGVVNPIDSSPSQFVALDPTLTLGSATEITLLSASGNLVFNPFGGVVSGTITGFVITSAADGIVRATVTGLNIDAAALYAAMIANDAAALDALLFGTDSFTYVGDTGADVFTAGLLADHLDGGDGDDLLIARDGADTLVGTLGADTLDGGAGGDTYELGANAAAVVILDSAGVDTVTSTISRSLAGFATVERLTLLGSADIDGSGNALANTIFGNAVDNVLDGGAGNDILLGGNGDDTYVLGADNDTIGEGNGASTGIDTITSTITRTLVPYGGIENLVLEGAANIDGTGNTLDNAITGNDGDNLLDGGAGSDTLSGGDGDDTLTGGSDTDADTLQGGAGDDLYELGSNYGGICTDTSGLDTVTSTGDRSLAFFTGIENLTLLGSDDIDGTGNDLDNTITGNAGANVLEGGLGLDTLVGGFGDDVYVFGANAADVVSDTGGIDTITSTVGRSLAPHADVENLVLLGGANINGTGNGLDNTITGNAGNNELDGDAGTDTLLGGQGNDTLHGSAGGDLLDGGQGDDTYALGSSGAATIVDAAGTDTVTSTISRSIVSFAAIENLTLLGGGNIDGTGNALANTITGNADHNVLDGGAGLDTLLGGNGNDTYVLGASADVVSDTGGVDTISSVISRSLVPFGDIENLLLLGIADIDGTGNSLANTITGNSGNNILDGGAGLDTLLGGNGNDTYVLANGFDVATDSGGIDLATSTVSRSLVAYADIENLTLLGSANLNGIGNALANTIVGNSGVNVLEGGGGIDTLKGGAGNDRYTLGNGTDVVIDSSGMDLITSTITRSLVGYSDVENLTLLGTGNINGTGNALANVIAGTIGNNILIGGAGLDTLKGGAGNDRYVLGAESDVVVDTAGDDGVYSTISRSLAPYAAIENLVLQGSANIDGTGNALNNRITGNAGKNILDGGLGDDTLVGNTGHDTYVLGAEYDTVIDGNGIGTITSTITRSLVDYATIENLQLVGNGSIHGTGNALDNTIEGNGATNVLNGKQGDDHLIAKGGNDILDGSVGADTLDGGAGSDAYILGNNTSPIFIIDGGGDDLVISSISRSLVPFASIERLTLLGNANIEGEGNALANTIVGNMGNNKLIGGAGDDTLIGGNDVDGFRDDTLQGGAGDDVLHGGLDVDYNWGGSGNDRFDFDKPADSRYHITGHGSDVVWDFSQSADLIDLFDVDANHFAPGNGTFTFVGTGAFTGTSGQLHYDFRSTNVSGQTGWMTVVSGDINGDKQADIEIRLVGKHHLTASDFIL